ncbi:DUF3820 family protein [Oceanimonas sp. NS1]|nr:DUF3820 family protein [Oceanimonas sp. NS1]
MTRPGSGRVAAYYSQTHAYGKYRGQPLLRLPLAYLCWMERKGWPAGGLGAELALVYELKHNGLDQSLYALL